MIVLHYSISCSDDIFTLYSSVNVHDLSDFLNEYNDFEDLMVNGSWFHKVGAPF